MLAHILQLFGSFVAPLVIFFVKRDSYYVRFHALQALLWQLFVFIVTMVVFVGFFMTMFATIASSPSSKAPPAVLFLFPIIWLAIMGP